MAGNTLNINAKSVLRYVLLPGIIPRAKELGGGGFAYLAFLFASVYRSVRILPPTHPFVNPANIGTFTIRQVIAAAANNIQFNRKNIDQILVFFVILTAVALMFLQFILLLLGIFTSNAFAAATTGNDAFMSMFITPSPATDIAFLMLDYVFGIPGEAANSAYFGSNALRGGPTPFHQGMHALFNFYNLAILLVGVLIFLYYVVVVVIETAETGVPFGRRFSKLYAPFRLIIAVGLLVPLPLGYGFNTAQYITLYAAKIGSSFATNGWITYNRALQGTAADNPLGVNTKSLVARPQTPPIDELSYFASVFHACKEMYKIWSPDKFQNPQKGTKIGAYVVVNGSAQTFYDPDPAPNPDPNQSNSEYSYEKAKKDFGGGEMEIVLGEHDPIKHNNMAGGVKPYCGKITISLANDNPGFWTQQKDSNGNPTAGIGADGVRSIENLYYGLVKTLLMPQTSFAAFGERMAHANVPTCPASTGDPGCTRDVCWRSGELNDTQKCENTVGRPNATVFAEDLSRNRTYTDRVVEGAYKFYKDNMKLNLTPELERRGWGGAGIWYNNIADINGTFTGAVYATPTVRQYPAVMEFVKNQRLANDQNSTACSMFDPNIGGGKSIDWKNTIDSDIAVALNSAYKYFNCKAEATRDSGTPAQGTGSTAGSADLVRKCGGSTTPRSATTRGMTANFFVDVIGIVFGLNGLFDIRACSEVDPNTGDPLVHPLAQLSTIGKGLVENSIRSMGMAIGASFGGGIAGMLGSALGPALESASGMFVGIATIGLSAGFILYYILPFLPFIYFFFAVGSWVKSIFEAMVGVPLWALAHLHIDGDGLPGRAAMPGYFLIFEIFIRPICTVFGLVGGMAIFGAMAIVLNNLFDLVVLNATGVSPGQSNSTLNIDQVESLRRGLVDEFFFTIMYAILLYMMATSSFKMIDMVPKAIMRWLNSGVSTFNDSKGDPTQHLTQYAAIGGSQITGQIFQGATQGSKALGQGVGALINEVGGTKKK